MLSLLRPEDDPDHLFLDLDELKELYEESLDDEGKPQFLFKYMNEDMILNEYRIRRLIWYKNGKRY